MTLEPTVKFTMGIGRDSEDGGQRTKWPAIFYEAVYSCSSWMVKTKFYISLSCCCVVIVRFACVCEMWSSRIYHIVIRVMKRYSAFSMGVHVYKYMEHLILAKRTHETPTKNRHRFSGAISFLCHFACLRFRHNIPTKLVTTKTESGRSEYHSSEQTCCEMTEIYIIFISTVSSKANHIKSIM